MKYYSHKTYWHRCPVCNKNLYRAIWAGTFAAGSWAQAGRTMGND